MGSEKVIFYNHIKYYTKSIKAKVYFHAKGFECNYNVNPLTWTLVCQPNIIAINVSSASYSTACHYIN